MKWTLSLFNTYTATCVIIVGLQLTIIFIIIDQLVIRCIK